MLFQVLRCKITNKIWNNKIYLAKKCKKSAKWRSLGDLGGLKQYYLHTPIHLAVVVGGVGDDGVAFAAALDLDAVGVDATADHGTADLLTTAFRKGLIRAVRTDIIRMTDDADALMRTHIQERIELRKGRFGRAENTRLARRKIDIMQDEGLDFPGRHDHTVERAADENRIMEGEITNGRGIDGIEGHAVIQERGDGRMDAIRGGLHHLTVLMIAYDDVRRHRTFGQRIGDGKRDARLRIERHAEAVLVFAMVKIEGIGREIADLGRLHPVFADGQSLGDAGMLGVGRLVEFGFLVGPRVDILHNDMRCRQSFAGLEVIRIDVKERLAVLDTLFLGGLGLGDALLLRRRFLGRFLLGSLAFGSFALALCRRERLGGLRLALGVGRNGIKRLSEDGEEHKDYEEPARAHTIK